MTDTQDQTGRKFKTIYFEKFYTPEGEHTCCLDYPEGKQCLFFEVTGLKARVICTFPSTSGMSVQHPSDYREYTVPHDKCVMRDETNI